MQLNFLWNSAIKYLTLTKQCPHCSSTKKVDRSTITEPLIKLLPLRSKRTLHFYRLSHVAGSFEYFSSVSWQNVKLCQEKALAECFKESLLPVADVLVQHAQAFQLWALQRRRLLYHRSRILPGAELLKGPAPTQKEAFQQAIPSSHHRNSSAVQCAASCLVQ